MAVLHTCTLSDSYVTSMHPQQHVRCYNSQKAMVRVALKPAAAHSDDVDMDPTITDWAVLRAMYPGLPHFALPQDASTHATYMSDYRAEFEAHIQRADPVSGMFTMDTPYTISAFMVGTINYHYNHERVMGS